MATADDEAHAAYVAQAVAYREGLKAHMAALRERWAAEAEQRPRRRRAPKAPADHQTRTDGRAKITADEVRAIRRRHASGENRNVLATEFGVTPRTINLIAARRRWAHLPD